MTDWLPDRELETFEATTLPLHGPTFNGEPAELCATLVRRNEPASKRAVLYVHGWSDYFFQTHLADAMAGLGYDFYAVDLRRYGRSLRDGQFAGFTTDLTEYGVELDEAARIIRDEDGHTDIVLMGHSTGGLVAALWASERPGVVSAVVLNSPWLELQSYPALRPALQPMFAAVRTLSPTAVLPISDNGFYRRCTSGSEEGEWAYNLNLKGDKAFTVRVGWLSAVMAGHAKVAAGLSIEVPVLCLISARSDFRRKWDEELRRADIVLDVERLAARASNLGRHVTIVRIPDGMHDLALSDEPARSAFFTEVELFLGAYGPH